MLLERPGELVTREDMQKRLWPADTFVDFDHSLDTAINKIRETLADSADTPRFVETIPRKGYRFVGTAAEGLPAAQLVGTNTRAANDTPVASAGASARATHWRVIAPFALLVIALGAASYFYFHRTPRLTEKDTIVLADFTNTTGDSVFDSTLRQGLAAQPHQCPFS